MTTKNQDPKPSDDMDTPKQEASACVPDCGCHAAGPASSARWIVGAIIILAAGVLMARAMMKTSGTPAEKAVSGFAALPAIGPVPAPAAGAAPATSATLSPSGRLPGDAATDTAPAAPAPVAVKEIGALSELNALAADTGGVFVFLPGTNEPLLKAPLAEMRSAAETLEAKGEKIGLFTLQKDAPDYTQIVTQISAPCVLAMVKGRGMIPVSGEITEPKLIQGFVAASSAGGCGPSGCGPSGCN